MKLKAAYAPLADGEAGFIIDGQQLTIRVHNGIVDVSDAPFADSIPLTQMQAQHLFFNRNGWLIAGRLPLGWAPLPAYINKVDEF